MRFPQPSLSSATEAGSIRREIRIPVQLAGVAFLGLEGHGRQRVERFVATVKAD